jgi:glycyl-tRNA synthetase beta chain
MARDLLFEMGVEEIPASYILPALDTLVGSLRSGLTTARLSFGSVRTFATPRRMTVVVEGVADAQTSETRTVTGPPARIAYGEDGTPTKAATGFARSQGVDVSALRVVDDYIRVEVTDKGRSAAEVLPGILSAAADAMTFPKTMKWGPERRFARPIRWLVAMLGNEVLDLEYAGVRAGNETYGLRFWSYGPHVVGGAAAYEDLLRDNLVIADHEKRRNMIASGAERAARDLGGTLVRDDALLDEVTFLTEFPTVCTGCFDERFLELPRDVIVAAMKGHQRYFAAERDGALLPHFLCIVNGPTDHHDVIREGNERVIESRLDDAEFYWSEDTRSPLEAKVENLRNVVWLEGVGTLYEKTERLTALAGHIAVVLAPGAREGGPCHRDG